MDAMTLSKKGNIIPTQKVVEVKREATADSSLGHTSSPDVVHRVTSGSPKTERTHDQVIAELQKAIDAIQGPKKTFEISVHEKTQAIMIKVLNKETGDLIREVPPEKILDLAARMMEITGIIIDKKI